MNSGRIIVAGSIAEHRKELRTALEFEAHEVLEAETAGQMIQTACSGLYDLLLVNEHKAPAPHDDPPIDHDESRLVPQRRVNQRGDRIVNRTDERIPQVDHRRACVDLLGP